MATTQTTMDDIFFLSSLSKKNVAFYLVYLYGRACETRVLKILLNNFIFFFMFFVHRKLIIKLPSWVEEYQLKRLKHCINFFVLQLIKFVQKIQVCQPLGYRHRESLVDIAKKNIIIQKIR